MAVSRRTPCVAEREEAAHTEPVRVRALVLRPPALALGLALGRLRAGPEQQQARARVQRAAALRALESAWAPALRAAALRAAALRAPERVRRVAVDPAGKPPTLVPKLETRRASTRERRNPRAKSQTDKPCG